MCEGEFLSRRPLKHTRGQRGSNSFTPGRSGGLGLVHLASSCSVMMDPRDKAGGEVGVVKSPRTPPSPNMGKLNNCCEEMGVIRGVGSSPV